MRRVIPFVGTVTGCMASCVSAKVGPGARGECAKAIACRRVSVRGGTSRSGCFSKSGDDRM